MSESIADTLSKAGQPFTEELAKLISRHRGILIDDKNELIADNTILNALYMMLSHHATFFITRTKDNPFDEVMIEEVSSAVQFELGRALHKIFGDNMGSNSTVCLQKLRKEGNDEGK